MQANRPRIAFYGHDTQGLGHLRRNLRLSEVCAAETPEGLGADVLLLTGASEIGLFERPTGVEAIVVPGVHKDERGGYRPRRLRGHQLRDLVDLRSATLRGALVNFAPDLLVVDKCPWGFSGELRDALKDLHRQGTKLVLGLRDVMDRPEVARLEWTQDDGDLAVRTLYSQVWVYGDRRLHDLPQALGMAPEVREKARHIGYLAPPPVDDSRPVPPPNLSRDRYLLVSVGGGRDGVELARAAATMTLPPGVGLVLLLGPQMRRVDADRIRAHSRPDRLILPFCEHAVPWLHGAAATITMGGANTVTEVLSTDVPALVVPRERPRGEQAVRARALAARGLLDVLPRRALHPRALGAWTEHAVGTLVDRRAVDLGGLDGVRRLARELICDRGQDAEHPVRAACA